MHTPLSVAAASLVLLATAANAQGTAPAPDTAGVRATVEHYLHGLKFNDVASLKQAFLPQTLLQFINGKGTLDQLTQDDWYKSFAASAGKEEAGDLRIVAMDVTANAASVKVVETYPKSVYTDYLNLLKIGTEWRIVNKIYTSRRR